MRGIQRTPSSIDNMKPGHPFIVTLRETPLDARVTAHSIIAVTRIAALLVVDPLPSGDVLRFGRIDDGNRYRCARRRGATHDRFDFCRGQRHAILLQLKYRAIPQTLLS